MRNPRFVVVFVLAALAASPAMAQQRPGRGGPGARGAQLEDRGRDASPEERFERHVQRMVGSLGLDAAQAARVRQIVTEVRAQREALRAERLTGDALRERHQQLMEQSGQRIRALLRPDQQRIFDFHAQQRRERGERRHDGQRGGGRLRALLGTLGLDATQTVAVQQIVQEAHVQRQALRAQALTGEERRARHRQILEQSGQRIRALLRPAQQQLFDAQVAQLRARWESRGPGRGAPGDDDGI